MTDNSEPGSIAGYCLTPQSPLRMQTTRGSPPMVRLRFLDYRMQPLAGVECTIGEVTLVSGSDGIAEVSAHQVATATSIRFGGLVRSLVIGPLAPLDDDSVTGWKARLVNLGFLFDAGDAEDVRFALQDFQAEHGLEVTGVFDKATKAQLQVYESAQ